MGAIADAGSRAHAPPPVANDSIRLARADELEALSAIEDRAGEMYAEVGIPDDLEGLPLETFAAAQADAALWVIADDTDSAVAFALCWRRPDALHIRELDVDPPHMRRGLGRRLIEHVRDRAAGESRAWVTLTTFAEVPWNGPLYRRYGFSEVADLPEWLAEIREEEGAHGLDRWPRIAMRIPSTRP